MLVDVTSNAGYITDDVCCIYGIQQDASDEEGYVCEHVAEKTLSCTERDNGRRGSVTGWKLRIDTEFEYFVSPFR